MFHDNMDHGKLMVLIQKVEGSHPRKRNRGSKKSRSYDQSNSSNGNYSCGVRYRHKFKKGHKNSNNPTSSNNSNSKEGNGRNSKLDCKSCGKCRDLHGDEILVGNNSFYQCGKSWHMMRDCPHMRNQCKIDAHHWPNPTVAAEPPKRNKFYALNGRVEQEKSDDVVTGTLHVFSFNVYAFLYPGSTLSFFSTLVASKFDLLPKILY